MVPTNSRRCSLIGFTALILLLFASSSIGSPQNSTQADDPAKTWTAPDPATIPQGPVGDSIRLGLQMFNDTPKSAAPYVGNKMSCAHCHVGSGTVAQAMPLVGVPGMFPLYRGTREGSDHLRGTHRAVLSAQRIRPPRSEQQPGNDRAGRLCAVAIERSAHRAPFPGRGLVKLPADLTGDVDRGSLIFAKQCALCHGAEGAGQLPTIPALWGPDSYSDGAGMNNVERMAAFVQHNMPQNDPGSLTPQQAFDVATYVHSKPHSHFELKDHQ